MPHDIDWVLDEMCNGAINDLKIVECNPILMKYGEKWKKYIKSGTWSIHPDPFWTYPFDYSTMAQHDQQLYSILSEASLLIFKGDLNYRKLVGDLKWKPTDTFKDALQGFHPAPLVTLRTLVMD